MPQQSVRTDMFRILADLFGPQSITDAGVGERSGVMNIPEYRPPTAPELAYQERIPATPTPPRPAEPNSSLSWNDWMSQATQPAVASMTEIGESARQAADAEAQQYRDMRAARYFNSLDGPARGNSSMGPLFGALVGNQLGGFLNYGANLDQQYNSPSGAYGQLQHAATQQRPYASQERIASMQEATKRQRNQLVRQLAGQLFGNALNTQPLAGVATDYGAGVAVPIQPQQSNWAGYRPRG